MYILGFISDISNPTNIYYFKNTDTLLVHLKYFLNVIK